jgi:threonine/homoserine/homoserine lactone efflux protein
MLEFVVLSFLLELTPGPNMGFLAALTMAQGRRAGLMAIGGVALGLSAYGIAAALGLMALLFASPLAYEVLRWAGVAYMLYLAWEIWQTPVLKNESIATSQHSAQLFLKGFITNVLNPKAGLFFMYVLPQFIPHNSPRPLYHALTLVAVYVMIATLVHLTIVMMAERAHFAISHNRWEARVRNLMAIMLIIIAFWIVIQTQR